MLITSHFFAYILAGPWALSCPTKPAEGTEYEALKVLMLVQQCRVSEGMLQAQCFWNAMQPKAKGISLQQVLHKLTHLSHLILETNSAEMFLNMCKTIAM